MRVALAAAAVTLSLFAAEAALRVLDWPRFDACDATADYAIPDPVLGFRGAPHGVVAGVRLDERGLRGASLAEQKRPGERRLLFVGDSTCWGLGVELDETFAARTAQRLGGDTSFALGAFPGYSSYHSAIVLEELLPLAPDLVVLYVGARNDGSRARYFADDEIPARRARLAEAWHGVRLLRLGEVAVDRAYRSFFRKLRSRAARARVPPERFRANVAGMLERLAERGVPALVVVPPLSPAFDAQEPQMRAYREILRDVARASAVPLVEVDEAFAREEGKEEEGGELYFEDDFHLAPRGHALVAEAVLDAIGREALLSP